MWLELLEAAVAASTQTDVARELGLSPTTLSLVRRGKYPASTKRVEERVIERYSRVQCPFLEREITVAACRDHHSKEPPTCSPQAFRHWRACQGCSENPSLKEHAS